MLVLESRAQCHEAQSALSDFSSYSPTKPLLTPTLRSDFGPKALFARFARAQSAYLSGRRVEQACIAVTPASGSLQ